MRNSKQRDLVLNIVQSTQSHPTAGWVYEQARIIKPDISLGTIYRNLGQLVENNSLITINIGGSIHYDAFLDDHHHFQCKTCNKVLDIEVGTKKIVSNVESKTNHKIDGCQIRFDGICEKCQNN